MKQPEQSLLERELVIAAASAAKLARALTLAVVVLRKDHDVATVRLMRDVSPGEVDQNGGRQAPLPFPAIAEDPFE